MPTLNSLTDIRNHLLTKKLIDCDANEINQQLAKIYLIIGLRPQHFPTDYENQFLIDYIKTNHGQTGIGELYFAFQLAVQDKLEVESVNPYDQFSVIYFERIMIAYRSWKNKKYIEESQIRIEPKQIEYKMTDAEKWEEINDWQQRNEIDIRIIPIYLYEWLEEFGEIMLDKNEKIKIYEQAAQMYLSIMRKQAEQQNTWQEFNRYINQHTLGFKQIKGEYVPIIRNLSMRIAVYNYLKNTK